MDKVKVAVANCLNMLALMRLEPEELAKAHRLIWLAGRLERAKQEDEAHEMSGMQSRDGMEYQAQAAGV